MKVDYTTDRSDGKLLSRTAAESLYPSQIHTKKKTRILEGAGPSSRAV